jgi:hypothetical protein
MHANSTLIYPHIQRCHFQTWWCVFKTWGDSTGLVLGTHWTAWGECHSGGIGKCRSRHHGRKAEAGGHATAAVQRGANGREADV